MSSGPVMVIDDSPDLRELFAQIFSLSEIPHLIVASAKDALEHLASGVEPSVIFCDCNLPTMSGTEFIAELRREPRATAIPVVLLSAVVGLAGIARRAGAAGYICKPVAFQDLVDVALIFRGNGVDPRRRVNGLEIF